MSRTQSRNRILPEIAQKGSVNQNLPSNVFQRQFAQQ